VSAIFGGCSLGTTGCRRAFAGDLSLTILLFLVSGARCCLFGLDASMIKGIGLLISRYGPAFPGRSESEGVWQENRELESPMLLRVLLCSVESRVRSLKIGVSVDPIVL
jgi:hypothetical protein